MKRLTGIWLLMLLASWAFGQNFDISGKLMDEQTKEPIPGVQVRIRGTVKGAVTNKFGHFRLEAEGRSATLEISHIGYEKKFVDVKRGQGPVTISLTPRDVQLNDVVIQENGIERVIEDKTLYLFDYAHYGDHLFVLLHDKDQNRPILALVDERDSIIDTDFGFEAPHELFTDCMGNVHAIGDEFACQLHVLEGNIVMYKDPLQTFEEYVKPCQANVEELYFYKRIRFNGQLLEYIYWNAEKQAGEVFTHIMDKEKIHQLMDPHQDNIYRGLFSTEAQLYALSESEWEQIAKLNPSFMFYQRAFFYPIPAQIKNIDNRVTIFDHTNGKIETWSQEGELIDEVEITYHKAPKWRKDDILVDEVRGEAFAVFKNGTWTELREINLDDGTIGEHFEIPKEHISDISVRDGVIYFLYREANYDDVKRLYRWRVK